MIYPRPWRRQTPSLLPLLLSLLLLFLPLPLPAQAGEEADAEFLPEVKNLLPAPQALPKTLRVVSFNVHYAHDVASLAESLHASLIVGRADVLLIQEIESHEAEGSSRAHKLAQDLKLNYVYAPARRTDDGGTHGLAILSRFPLADIEVLPLPRYDLGFNTRRRIALAATLDMGGHPLRVYNVHLDTRINIKDRIEQLRPVVEAAQRQPVAEVIIGGDFNTNSFRWLFHRIPFFRSNQAGALDEFMRGNQFSTPLTESGSTVKRVLLRARVDSLYTRGLTALESGVERTVEASDHYPVWMDVAWPPTARR